MVTKLHLEISGQPDDTTCGPTCLHAVYRYYGDAIPLRQVIAEVKSLSGGGTLAVLLGNHALSRGYRAGWKLRRWPGGTKSFRLPPGATWNFSSMEGRSSSRI